MCETGDYLSHKCDSEVIVKHLVLRNSFVPPNRIRQLEYFNEPGELSVGRDSSLNVSGETFGSSWYLSSNTSRCSKCFIRRSMQNIWIELQAVWRMCYKVARMPTHRLVIHVLIGINDPLVYKSDSLSYLIVGCSRFR